MYLYFYEASVTYGSEERRFPTKKGPSWWSRWTSPRSLPSSSLFTVFSPNILGSGVPRTSGTTTPHRKSSSGYTKASRSIFGMTTCTCSVVLQGFIILQKRQTSIRGTPVRYPKSMERFSNKKGHECSLFYMPVIGLVYILS